MTDNRQYKKLQSKLNGRQLGYHFNHKHTEHNGLFAVHQPASSVSSSRYIQQKPSYILLPLWSRHAKTQGKFVNFDEAHKTHLFVAA